MFRKIGFSAAAVLTVGVLALGCSDDGDTTITLSGGTTLPTTADSISTRLEDSWATNEASINASPSEDGVTFRVLRGRDGSGFMVWCQGDDGNGNKQLWLAHFGASGAMDQPHLVFADVEEGGYGDDTVESFVMCFTPDGDAVMAFIATQDDDPSSSTDSTSERVYYGTWTRTGGFSTFEAIDTNSSPSATDDNGVGTLFLASNLIDGTQTYDVGSTPDNDLEDAVSGTANASPTDLTPFIYAQQKADRDFVLDSDTLFPTHAFLAFPEIRTGDDEEGGVDWSVRVLDLTERTFTNVEDRLAPALTASPAKLNRTSQISDVNESELFLLPEGDDVLAVFNLDDGSDDSNEGRFYVNVARRDGTTASAALVTNDSALLIDNHGEGTVDGDEYMMVPGANCDGAVGAWFFYVRLGYPVDDSGLDQYFIQGRRFFSTNLPN